MKRFFVTLSLFAAVLLPNAGDAPLASTTVVGPEVLAALAASGSARVVVLFDADRSPEGDLRGRSRAVSRNREGVLDQLDERDFRVTETFENLSVIGGFVTETGLRKLTRDYRVQRVDLDMPGYLSMAESTNLIRARDVQAAGVTGKGVVVAVLDSGIDSDHPDLQDDVILQQCFCSTTEGAGCCPGGKTEASGPGAAEDELGHGTHVSGIITSSGAAAPRGVAPDADLVVIRILDKTGAVISSTSLMKALDWLISTQPAVKVVNVSMVIGAFGGACDAATSVTAGLAQAVNTLKQRGTVTVASAGNSGSKTTLGAPACLSQVVGVGAVYDGNVGTISFGCTDGSTAADKIACFSNSGTALDLLAPGAAVTSSGLGGGVAGFGGTSQAAPHVAGALALLLQVKPTATVDELVTALKTSGRPLVDTNGVSVPRLDVGAAVAAMKK
jgi:subtilisin family serine protease